TNGSRAAAATRGGRGAPLSPPQQAALLPERLRNRRAANLFLALRIDGELTTAAVETAAAELVDRHEILRTVYPTDRRVPYQRVCRDIEACLQTAEFADTEELTAALAADATHRFDLVAGPPLRIGLYRVGEHTVLSVAVHPIAADDHSLELIAAELLGARIDPAPPQYRTYATSQVKALGRKVADDPELSYWVERLTGLPGRADVAVGDAVDGTVEKTLRLPKSVVDALGDLEAATAAALATVLAQAGLGQDIAIGIRQPGRGAELAGAVGCYANYLVLRLDPASSATPRELIATVAETADRARAHSGARIERLAHELRGAAVVGAGVPFQALVTVRTAACIAARGVSAREIGRQIARPHGTDIVADVVTDEDGATLNLDFPAAADRPESGAIARAVAQLLVNWAAAPGDPPSTEISGVPVVFEYPVADFAGGPGLGGEPGTDAERLLAECVREVLDLDDDDPVGREDTFFSLGGDSIAALRLVTLLGERGYLVDVQQVFEYPTVREFATRLDPDRPAPDRAESAPVAPMAASGLDAGALAALGAKFAAR
ncbi:MAG: thioester reductase, partial [Nocardia sp.]|nr:thioester reductase [Nocardia sp.]